MFTRQLTGILAVKTPIPVLSLCVLRAFVVRKSGENPDDAATSELASMTICSYGFFNRKNPPLPAGSRTVFSSFTTWGALVTLIHEIEFTLGADSSR